MTSSCGNGGGWGKSLGLAVGLVAGGGLPSRENAWLSVGVRPSPVRRWRRWGPESEAGCTPRWARRVGPSCRGWYHHPASPWSTAPVCWRRRRLGTVRSCLASRGPRRLRAGVAGTRGPIGSSGRSGTTHSSVLAAESPCVGWGCCVPVRTMGGGGSRSRATCCERARPPAAIRRRACCRPPADRSGRSPPSPTARRVPPQGVRVEWCASPRRSAMGAVGVSSGRSALDESTTRSGSTGRMATEPSVLTWGGRSISLSPYRRTSRRKEAVQRTRRHPRAALMPLVGWVLVYRRILTARQPGWVRLERYTTVEWYRRVEHSSSNRGAGMGDVGSIIRAEAAGSTSDREVEIGLSRTSVAVPQRENLVRHRILLPVRVDLSTVHTRPTLTYLGRSYFRHPLGLYEQAFR